MFIWTMKKEFLEFLGRKHFLDTTDEEPSVNTTCNECFEELEDRLGKLGEEKTLADVQSWLELYIVIEVV